MKPQQYLVMAVISLAITPFTPAFSQDNSKNNETTSKRTLSTGIGFPDNSQPLQSKIGLGIGPFPEFEGSDTYGISAMPLIDIRKAGRYFIKGASINTNEGLASAGATLFHITFSEGTNRPMQILVGPLIRAFAGREESDSDVLSGLGDIDQSAGVGAFLELRAGAWLTSLSVAPQDVGNDKDGMLAVLNVEYSSPISERLRISTGLSTSWADDDYMQGYFGISDTQAARSGLVQYESKAGFKDVGLQVKTSYTLTSRWSFEGQIGYWRLLNDAADSPIVKDKGSTNQLRGLAGFLYQF